MFVHDDEAVTRLGYPVDRLAAQGRQHDHTVGLDRASRKQVQLPVSDLCRRETGVECDPAFREERSDCMRRLGAEQQERLVLGRHERDPNVVQVSGVDVGGEHQRELVRREGPHGPARNGHDDALEETAIDPGQDVRDQGGVGGAAERQRPGHSRLWRGAAREQQRVVLEPQAARRERDVLSCVDAHQPSRVTRAFARCARSARSNERASPQPERLGNREWPVPEPRFRRDELHVDELGRELVQCERRLECCDTAACDHDAPASAHAADHRFRESRFHRGRR